MLAVSTTCLSILAKLTNREIDRLFDADVVGHELGPEVPADSLDALADAIRRGKRTIVSLRAPCPGPRVSAEPDRLAPPARLSSLDASERQEAIERARNTLELSAKLEARHVILDGGVNSATFDVEQIEQLIARREWAADGGRIFREHFAERRAKFAPAHLDALRFALEPLLELAESLEIQLALLNPGSPERIPNHEEFIQIAETFRGAPLGLWFDPAHASVLAELGFEDPLITQSIVEEHVVGVQLHDRHELEYGYLPGEGSVDYRAWAERLPPEIPKVLTPIPTHSGERIGRSLEYLRSLGFEGPPPKWVEPFPIIGGGSS